MKNIIKDRFTNEECITCILLSRLEKMGFNVEATTKRKEFYNGADFIVNNKILFQAKIKDKGAIKERQKKALKEYAEKNGMQAMYIFYCKETGNMYYSELDFKLKRFDYGKLRILLQREGVQHF